MEIRNLIGMEFMDGENMLKIVEVKKEEENIILVTETLNNKETKTEIKKYSFSEQSLNMFKNVHPNLVKIMKDKKGRSIRIRIETENDSI